MESRNKQLVGNVEKTLYEAAFDRAIAQGITTSAYIRKLVMEDLKSQGLLTEEMREALL